MAIALREWRNEKRELPCSRRGPNTGERLSGERVCVSGELGAGGSEPFVMPSGALPDALDVAEVVDASGSKALEGNATVALAVDVSGVGSAGGALVDGPDGMVPIFVECVDARIGR